ncbi:lipopolysaccharide biosynthesis protein [Salmonella enterica subsp. arizonae]|uniref:Lipopolysaccharide biosynthesis protein n=1 Tax=Salmonella enterica subsp. arizonae TaxID=59203 RepID=A0A3S4GQR9_SALER|nr:lipopolysaccharide biosynthesis protein [Salmonella enterica subsp. arizonae]
MTQPLPGARAVSAENELDIRGLFRTLWAGKFWIIGIGLLFALIALAYTFLLVRSGARRRSPIAQP